MLTDRNWAVSNVDLRGVLKNTCLNNLLFRITAEKSGCVCVGGAMMKEREDDLQSFWILTQRGTDQAQHRLCAMQTHSVSSTHKLIAQQ